MTAFVPKFESLPGIDGTEEGSAKVCPLGIGAVLVGSPRFFSAMFCNGAFRFHILVKAQLSSVGAMLSFNVEPGFCMSFILHLCVDIMTWTNS